MIKKIISIGKEIGVREWCVKQLQMQRHYNHHHLKYPNSAKLAHMPQPCGLNRFTTVAISNNLDLLIQFFALFISLIIIIYITIVLFFEGVSFARLVFAFYYKERVEIKNFSKCKI